MVRWLVTYLALVDPWSPDRVGAFRDTFVVLALPCCTETEPDLEDFLALEPSNGLGCGYVGLIVSSWLTLSREGWASAAGHGRPGKAIRRFVGGRTGASVCAALGGGAKGAQIGLRGFGCFWGANCPEIPEGCARLVVACRMVVLIEARRMGRSEVSFPSPYARRASPLPTDLRRGRLCWSANERKPNGLEDQRADVPEVHPLRRAVPAPAHHGEGVPRHQALRRTGNLQPLLPGAPAGIHSQGTHRLDRRAQVLIVRPEDAPPEVFCEGLAGYAPLLRAGEVLHVREGGPADVSDGQGAG